MAARELRNILIVDDTPQNLHLLVDILTKYDYKARPVPNGKLALSAAEISPPDLILLDITMPDLNGYEVCKKLKENPKTQDIPVIFISAGNEAVDKIKAFANRWCRLYYEAFSDPRSADAKSKISLPSAACNVSLKPKMSSSSTLSLSSKLAREKSLKFNSI